MAPQLKADDTSDVNDIEGSTDHDLQALSTRIVTEPIDNIKIVLTNDLTINTSNIRRASKTLKKLISPQKSVRFSGDLFDSNSVTQLDPMENARRSNRIALRRASLFHVLP